MKKLVRSQVVTVNTVIWFCLFALYQPADGHGPTIGEQLAMDGHGPADCAPFGGVIWSPRTKFMVVIHTTTAEVYGRLWCAFHTLALIFTSFCYGRCVFEMREAFMQIEFRKNKEFVQPALSGAYVLERSRTLRNLWFAIALCVAIVALVVMVVMDSSFGQWPRWRTMAVLCSVLLGIFTMILLVVY